MKRTSIILGDLVTLVIVTLVGFASHAELSSGFLPRMAAAFLPLCLGWFILAPWFGLFDEAVAEQTSLIWLPAFVMLFAGPFAVVVRGLALQAPIMPIFAVVLSVTGAVALTIWRLLWLVVKARVQ